MTNFDSGAEVLIENKRRARIHGASERTPDIDGVMATIVDESKLTWTRSLCWATNALDPAKLHVCTTAAEVRQFYTDLLEREELAGQRPASTDIRSGWYTFGEVVGTPMRNRHTGERHAIDSAVLTMYDGGEGISAEIGWMRAAEVTLDPVGRAQLWAAYIAALREASVAGAIATMSADVQGAVRDYFDADPPFVGIYGVEAMRAYYEKLFAHVEVVEIDVVRLAVQEWFVFAELSWKVRIRQGEDQGRALQFLTAEHMAFDGDGRFHSRCGFGTDME